MTDNARTAPPPDLAEITANIRAELARAGRGPVAARASLEMGEVAWRTRMNHPTMWRLGELEELASWLGVELAVLLRGTER